MDKKLDNFESFIKNSMDSHETPYSNGAWESMQEAMSVGAIQADSFESFVKNSMESHEVPYTSAAWKSFAPLLGKLAVPFYKTKGFIAAVSAVVIAGVAIFGLADNSTESKEDILAQEVSVKKENVAAETSINKAETNNAETVVNVDLNEIATADVEQSSQVNETSQNTQLISDVNNGEVNTVSGQNEDLNNTPNNDRNSIADVNKVNDIENADNTPNDNLPTEVKEYIASFDTKLSFCEGEKLTLTPREVLPELTYQWLLNGKSISKEATITTTLNTVGENNIDLIAYKNGVRVSSRAKTINVNEIPKAIVNHKEDNYSLINNHSFKLNSATDKVVWNFGDGESSKEQLANHTYKKQGKYTLSYNVTNQAGCSASHNQSIMIKGYYNIREELFFSPDGDGSLDVFLPEELKQINKPFEMVIYNRQNKIVYRTNSINNPWDGRDLEGNMVPFGVYVWVINMTNEFGHDEQYLGNVTKASN